MRKAARTALCYLLLAAGLVFLASTVVVTEVAYKSGEAVTLVGFWWPVAAGVACLQFAIRLSVAPQLRDRRAWLGEAGQNAAALALFAGSFVFMSLASDEKQSLGERVLFAVVMPASAWACWGGWLWLCIRTRRDPSTERAVIAAAGTADQRRPPQELPRGLA